MYTPSQSPEERKALAATARAEYKRYGKRQAKVAKLQAMKGPEAVTARKELKRMRDSYYSTDARPSAGQAWKPDGHNMARGSTGRTKKMQSGYDAKRKQGMNIGRP